MALPDALGETFAGRITEGPQPHFDLAPALMPQDLLDLQRIVGAAEPEQAVAAVAIAGFSVYPKFAADAIDAGLDHPDPRVGLEAARSMGRLATLTLSGAYDLQLDPSRLAFYRYLDSRFRGYMDRRTVESAPQGVLRAPSFPTNLPLSVLMAGPAPDYELWARRMDRRDMMLLDMVVGESTNAEEVARAARLAALTSQPEALSILTRGVNRFRDVPEVAIGAVCAYLDLANRNFGRQDRLIRLGGGLGHLKLIRDLLRKEVDPRSMDKRLLRAIDDTLDAISELVLRPSFTSPVPRVG